MDDEELIKLGEGQLGRHIQLQYCYERSLRVIGVACNSIVMKEQSLRDPFHKVGIRQLLMHKRTV